MDSTWVGAPTCACRPGGACDAEDQCCIRCTRFDTYVWPVGPLLKGVCRVLCFLFVPSHEAVAALSGRFDELTHWGPFNIVAELMEGVGNVHDSGIVNGALRIPILLPNHAGEWHQGTINGQPQSIGLIGMWVDSDAWQWVRFLMDGIVYGVFGFAIVGRLFPKQVV